MSKFYWDLNTNGNINFIEIKNSALDAFDAEFSNIKIKDIKVLKTNGECIGIRGNFEILNSNLTDCGDKAISVGAWIFKNL